MDTYIGDEFFPHIEEMKLKEKLKDARENHDRSSKEQTVAALISLYITYGEHFKMSDKPDPSIAKQYFKKALVYDRDHPVANYRLAHLLYRKGQYAEAMYYFNRSLAGSRHKGLNDTQTMLSNMFIVNCGIFAAKEAIKEIEEMEENLYTELEEERIERYQKEIVVRDEKIFNRMFYRKISKGKEEFITEEEFMSPKQLDKNTVILRSSDNGKEILYHPHNSIPMGPVAFNILCCIIAADKHITGMDIDNIFTRIEQKLSDSVIRQTLSRLKGSIPYWDKIIETKSVKKLDSSTSRTGRKRKEGVNWCVLCRVDDVLPFICR